MNPTIYKLLSVEEACEVLGVSENQVRKLALEGSIPNFRLSPNTVRFPYWLLIWNISLQCGCDPELLARMVAADVSTNVSISLGLNGTQAGPTGHISVEQ